MSNSSVLFLSPKQQNNKPTPTAIPEDNLFNNPGAFLFAGSVSVLPFRFLVRTLHVSFFELTPLVSQHSIFPEATTRTKGFCLRVLASSYGWLSVVFLSPLCFFTPQTFVLRPSSFSFLVLFSLSLSLVFLSNSLPVYITILPQGPNTYPKLYKINIFSYVFFLSLNLVLQLLWT